MQYLSFCVWLISLSIIPWRSTHLGAGVRISLLLRLSNIPRCESARSVYLSSVSGHLGCSLAIRNNAVVNTSVEISLWGPALSCTGRGPEVGLLDHTVVLFSVFWEPATFPTGTAHHFPSTTTVHKGSSLSTFSPALLMFLFFFFFDSSRPRECEVISHCGFDLHFPN